MSGELRIHQVLGGAYNDLQDFAAQNNGYVSIARDPWHVLELLVESPAGFRIVLHWAGDSELGGDPRLPLVTNNIEIIVSYNLGLTAVPDISLISAQASGRPALLDLVDQVRERVLSQEWPADITYGIAQYQSCEPVTLPDGMPLAAYRLRFGIDAAITEYSPTNTVEA